MRPLSFLSWTHVILILFLVVAAQSVPAKTLMPAEGTACPGIPQKSLALAAKGHRAAQVNVGFAMLDGICGRSEVHVRDAIEMLRSAALAGSAEAATRLAVTFQTGDLVAADPGRALLYYRLAAEGGHPLAQHRLGLMLVTGEAGERDQDAGLYWLGAAATQGDAVAAAVIGLMHARGLHGVKHDECLALDWYDASELMGSPIPLHAFRQELSDSATTHC